MRIKHHDFHDNLYILLSGSKRFVLYPPSEHTNLYSHGTLDEFHDNGLISYKDAPVRNDGLPVRVAARARVKAIEAKLEELLGAEKGKGKGKSKSKAVQKEVKKWEKMYDEALDELARTTLDAAREDGFGFGEGEEDDFDALMGSLEGGEEDDGDGAGPSRRVELDDGDDEDEGEEEEEEGPTLGDNDDELADSPSGEPSSFSRIPTHTLHTHLGLPTTAQPPSSSDAATYPNLQKTPQPYVVNLKAGEMLYLPASWWHEVTSTSAGDDDVHMAFNYWFYPPTGKTFEEPYEDALVWEYLKGLTGASNSASDGQEVAEKDGKRKRHVDEDRTAYDSKKKTKR